MAIFFVALPTLAESREVHVQDVLQLRTAIRSALPGDKILLLPGVYVLGRTEIKRPGELNNPIIIRAAVDGQAVIYSNAIELFVVLAGFWRFQNLDIACLPSNPNYCHHAFHIVGPADHTVLSGNRMREFHSAIKGNGNTKHRFPNHVSILQNTIYNSLGRKTDAPVTSIDVIGGRHWRLSDNFIADFFKDGGDRISYGAFLKGGSTFGVIERNLVICEWRHKGGTRIALSLGGGGSGPAGICQNQQCNPEHSNGILRNNIITDCPVDVGIYLNKAANSLIYNNTLYNTYGIDARFPTTSAAIVNNIITGGIRSRDDALVNEESNLVAGHTWSALARRAIYYLQTDEFGYPIENFISELAGGLHSLLRDSFLFTGNNSHRRVFHDPENLDFQVRQNNKIIDAGETTELVVDDFCGRLRNLPPHDLGAIESKSEKCDASVRIQKINRFAN